MVTYCITMDTFNGNFFWNLDPSHKNIKDLWVIVPTIKIANIIYTKMKRVNYDIKIMIPNNFQYFKDSNNVKKFLKDEIPGVQHFVVFNYEKEYTAMEFINITKRQVRRVCGKQKT